MLPELPITDPLLQFTLLIAAALLVQLALERVFVPGLLGLLLLGMLIGPDGAGVMPREPVVQLLGDIGLVYIMFTAGLEIDLDTVRRQRGQTLGFGALAFSLSLALGVGAGRLLGFDWLAAVLLGTLLSSHTLIAYPMLRRLGLDRTPEATAAIGGTVVTDTLALVLLAILLQLAGGADGGHAPGPWWLSLGLLAALVLVGLTGVPRLARLVFARDWITPAERSLFALFVLLMLSSAADLIGTENILGAFLAGLALNRVLAEHETTRSHVEFVGRLLFMPFFFVSTGMLLELDVVLGGLGTWGVGLLLAAVVLLGKAGAVWTVGALAGYRPAGRLLMLGLTVPQAAATLAITMAGREAGLLDAGTVDAVIIVILLTCAAGPLLSRLAGARMRDG